MGFTFTPVDVRLFSSFIWFIVFFVVQWKMLAVSKTALEGIFQKSFGAILNKFTLAAGICECGLLRLWKNTCE